MYLIKIEISLVKHCKRNDDRAKRPMADTVKYVNNRLYWLTQSLSVYIWTNKFARACEWCNITCTCLQLWTMNHSTYFIDTQNNISMNPLLSWYIYLFYLTHHMLQPKYKKVLSTFRLLVYLTIALNFD